MQDIKKNYFLCTFFRKLVENRLDQNEGTH